MIFRQLFDRATCTYTYLLGDEETRQAILIDPVVELVDRDMAVLKELGLTLARTLDTHVHADHVTAAGTLREVTGCKTIMSKEAHAPCVDREVGDGDVVTVGAIELEVRATPGHTSTCVSYYDRTGGRVFTGDTLMIRGCGRTDFQQGDSAQLYRSVHEKLFTLPPQTRVYPGHDYKGRTVSTIGEEQAHNPRLGGGRTVDEFQDIMANLKLSLPARIHIAVPANQSCGVVVQEAEEPEADPAEFAPVMSPDGVPEVSVHWLSHYGAEVKKVDVRGEDEFTGDLGHVPGAERVVWGRLAGVARDWDKQAPTVVICRSGGRSATGTLALQALGFQNVASLRGGMMQWKLQGLPIDR